MTVNELSLEGFRSYMNAGAQFSPGTNIITGINAQGKTNLVEAVYYLTCGRSFRARTDSEIINFGCSEAVIRADITSGGREQTVEARLFRGRRKTILINGVKQKTASALSGRLTAVLFCPDDHSMIRAGSAARRRVLDQCLCQIRPRYAEALTEYGRIYDQKSRILKDWREKPSLLEALDEYNDRMAEYGAILIYYRARLAAALSERAEAIHRDFSGGAETLSLSYETVKTVEYPLTMKPDEIRQRLMEHQASHRRAELESGVCLSGAHKDDLAIGINGRPAKSFASQGQTRTAALSVKMAEREILAADTGESPVLLLDDVLSELDAGRQDFVLNRVGGGQVFITCCEDDRISQKTGGRIFRITDGEIIPV